MRRAAIWLLGLTAIALFAILTGPRVPDDTTITFAAETIGEDAEAYLAKSEAAVSAIRSGQQKQIVWAREDKAKTPLAIVYVHGFSASSAEIRPLPDKVAAALGANLYFTRLTGHGQDGAAMAGGSVNAWINDYAEALAVGRMIGDRVVVIATSTGASLATLGATDPRLAGSVAGIVMISPNFGIQAAGSFLLTMPWGRQIAELIIGPERSFESRNPQHAQSWTTRYPTSALLPMARLVELAVAARVEDIKMPALFVFSNKDKIVRPDITATIAQRWGGPHQTLIVEASGDPDMHVIAGDILSPATTDALAQACIDWIKSLPQP